MIEFRDIVKTYNGQVAVSHLNLVVNDGELCILLGESGCGKSTSLNMINKLIEADSGEILIDGKSNNDFKVEELRRGIGYVVQSTGLFPNMTVAENIAVVPKMLKWDKKKIAERTSELLTMVGLDEKAYAKKYPSQLSGGEAQRVGVARALAADPKMLLMDEPFSALDPINRIKLQNEFLELQKKIGKTIIFVTHDIGEAMKMGDRIALMSKGVLQIYGTPKELLSNGDNAFVRSFMGNDSFINILNKYTIKEYMKPGKEGGKTPEISDRATLKDALACMIEASKDRLLVGDADGNCTGIIQIEALLDILREE